MKNKNGERGTEEKGEMGICVKGFDDGGGQVGLSQFFKFLIFFLVLLFAKCQFC